MDRRFHLLYLVTPSMLMYCDTICTSNHIIGGDLFMLVILRQITMHYDFMKREFLAMKYQQPTKRNCELNELLKLHVKIN